MRASLIAATVVLLTLNGSGEQAPTTVFKGRPTVKISEGGLERTPTQVTREQGTNLECVISQIGESYYWASRENVQLVRVEGTGAFVTFIATNGSGYVRIVKPEAKAAAALMGQTEERFDYVEHLLTGLRSITYYGTRQSP